MKQNKYIPSTQADLIREIQKISNLKACDLKQMYKDKVNSYPAFNKHNARRYAIRQLHAIYFKLLSNKRKWIKN